MNTPSAALAAAMRADADKTAPTEASLEVVRRHIRQARDNERQIADLQTRLKELGEAQTKLTQKTLPDLFTEVGIDVLGTPAEGNLPSYDAKLSPYYHANIATEWPDEKKAAAFNYLSEAPGGEDLIKTVITIPLGRGDRKTALKVEKSLDKLGVTFTSSLGVPWNTLTAWVKEQVEKHQTTPKLDLIGATVGNVVKLKERK